MKEKNAVYLLYIASFIWGVAFIFQRTASGTIGPCFFNAIRMFLGFIALLPLFFKSVKSHEFDKKYMHNLHVGGLCCGVATALPSILQQMGISYTTAGKAGFLTSTYMLFIPIISIFLKIKVSKRIWFCVFTGLAGAFLLSVNHESGINKGDILVLICAVMFAFQMLIITHFVKNLDGPDLSTFQFFFGSLTCLVIGLFTESIEIQQIKASYVSIIYTGIFSCGVAYTLQIIGQKYVSTAKAALPLSLENAWAAIAGAVVLGESMTVKEIAGCIILFVSVILSQLPGKNTSQSE